MRSAARTIFSSWITPARAIKLSTNETAGRHAAKAMWIFYEYPDFTFEKAVVPFGLPELRQKAKFIAIPSTSGTATEVTAFSVITDNKAHIKYPLADFNLTPDIAIVDSDLAQTMPPKLVAHTGMDALTHAIEAYTSTCSSKIAFFF